MSCSLHFALCTLRQGVSFIFVYAVVFGNVRSSDRMKVSVRGTSSRFWAGKGDPRRSNCGGVPKFTTLDNRKVSLFAQSLQTRNVDFYLELPLSRPRSMLTTYLFTPTLANEADKTACCYTLLHWWIGYWWLAVCFAESLLLHEV